MRMQARASPRFLGGVCRREKPAGVVRGRRLVRHVGVLQRHVKLSVLMSVAVEPRAWIVERRRSRRVEAGLEICAMTAKVLVLGMVRWLRGRESWLR